MQPHDRKQLQRQHEKYWGKWWAVALAQRLNARIQSNRPNQDPPDVDFHIRKEDGTEIKAWGEVTGVYYDSDEAKWLWGSGPEDQQGKGYLEPDAVVGAKAVELVENKRSKYSALVKRQGRGHLLVVLHHPLTTRGTRVEAERRIRDLLCGTPRESEPFETVWLGYRLPWTTEDEKEDSQYVFQDHERFNFMKCVWTREELYERGSPNAD